MHPRAFAIACDLDYFPACRALLNSLYVYHPEIPVYLYERRFAAAEMAWLQAHPLRPEVHAISHFPYHCPGLWEAKQQAMAECIGRARTVCLIDADIVLLSRIDDVFQEAERGKIVVGCDELHIEFDDSYAVYDPRLVGKSMRGFNSGFLCFDVQRHWDVLGLWAFSANYGQYSPHGGYPIALPGFGDQGLINAIITMLNKNEDCHYLPQGVWHDFREPAELRIEERGATGALVVQNVGRGERQRFLHSVGYKWWWEAPEPHHIGTGDKLACYRHFAGLSWPRSPLSF